MAIKDKNNAQPKPAATKAAETQMQASSRTKTVQAGTDQQAESASQMGVSFTDWASI